MLPPFKYSGPTLPYYYGIYGHVSNSNKLMHLYMVRSGRIYSAEGFPPNLFPARFLGHGFLYSSWARVLCYEKDFKLPKRWENFDPGTRPSFSFMKSGRKLFICFDGVSYPINWKRMSRTELSIRETWPE